MNTPKKEEEVLVLDLSNQSLKILSSDILKYPNLKELNISENRLTKLPEFLKELKYLEKLNISKNQIKHLPDFFRDFKDLRILNVSNNPISFLPFSLWKIGTLQSLNISALHIKKLPVEIGNLSSLEVLKANKLKINYLPDSIGYLRNLKEIYLENNVLKNLPSTFSYLTSLKKINLRVNNFQTFPKTIFDCKQLEYINISGNSIQTIPKQIGLLKEINYLSISRNKIRRVPLELYTLKNLKKGSFHFKKNKLSRDTIGEINRYFIGDQNKKTRRSNTLSKNKGKKKKSKKSNKIIKKPFTFSKVKVYMFIALLIAVLFYWAVSDVPMKQDNIQDNKEGYKNRDFDHSTKEDFKNKNFNKSTKADKKKDAEAYVLAKKKAKTTLKRVLAKTKDVYVYTNDPADLKLTIRANAKFDKVGYNKDLSDKRNAKYINKFLRVKRYGYSVSIDNGRKKFTQMWLHDSIISSRFIKKFRVVRYYKMTPEEVIYNKERDKKRITYRKKPRNDRVFAVNRGIVDFKELKNKKFHKKSRAIFTPRDIDLTRKDNYFYFSSLNGNVSKKEFLEAVEEFKEMFIIKGNPEKQCFVKKYKVERE